MNLTALTAALRTRLGVPTTDAMFTDATCTDLLNWSIKKINSDHDWGWLEKSEAINTVNGTATYTPGADWLRTLMVQYGDYPPLEHVSIDRIRMIGTPAGRPAFYTVFGDLIQLRPVPSAVVALTHLYIRTEPDLTAGGDIPLMPATYHPVLVEYAAYLGMLRISDIQEAGAALARYDKWLARQTTSDAESRFSADLGGGATAPSQQGAPPVSKGLG